MAYLVVQSDGSPINIADALIDTGQTTLGLVGRNAQTFGTVDNQNLVQLLENYAADVAPDLNVNVTGSTVLVGQIWYDNGFISAAPGLRVWDGASWDLVGGNSLPNRIQDADNDTYVDTELNVNTVNITAALGGGGVVIDPGGEDIQMVGAGPSGIESGTGLEISTLAGDITLTAFSGFVIVPANLQVGNNVTPNLNPAVQMFTVSENVFGDDRAALVPLNSGAIGEWNQLGSTAAPWHAHLNETIIDSLAGSMQLRTGFTATGTTNTYFGQAGAGQLTEVRAVDLYENDIALSAKYANLISPDNTFTNQNVFESTVTIGDGVAPTTPNFTFSTNVADVDASMTGDVLSFESGVANLFSLDVGNNVATFGGSALIPTNAALTDFANGFQLTDPSSVVRNGMAMTALANQIHVGDVSLASDPGTSQLVLRGRHTIDGGGNVVDSLMFGGFDVWHAGNPQTTIDGYLRRDISDSFVGPLLQISSDVDLGLNTASIVTVKGQTTFENNNASTVPSTVGSRTRFEGFDNTFDINVVTNSLAGRDVWLTQDPITPGIYGPGSRMVFQNFDNVGDSRGPVISHGSIQMPFQDITYGSMNLEWQESFGNVAAQIIPGIFVDGFLELTSEVDGLDNQVILSANNAAGTPILAYLRASDQTWVLPAGGHGVPSDVRVKKNIRLIDNAVEKLSKLRGVVYESTDNDTTRLGVIGQEVKAVFPEAISANPGTYIDVDGTEQEAQDFLTVNYSALVPALIEAIKEQQKQIDELKTIIQNI